MSREGMAYITFLVEKFGFRDETLGIIEHSIMSLKDKEKKKGFLNPDRDEKTITAYEVRLSAEAVTVSRGLLERERAYVLCPKKRFDEILKEGMEPILLLQNSDFREQNPVKLIFV